MALTEEHIALLSQTARRTPMGRFLRHFWFPVATVADLTAERPTKRVRILSQTLVLFKDTSGRAALIPERCPHEGTSMLLGAVGDHGITCVTHGWFFDTEQMCSVWDDDTVWAEGYPAREYAGLYWAYLGEEPAPPLPVLNLPSGPESRLAITILPTMRGHWLLPSVSGLDPWRFYRAQRGAEAEGTPVEIASIGFTRSAAGLIKQLTVAGGGALEQAYTIPTLLDAGPLWLLTPVDDVQTSVMTLETVGTEASDDTAPVITVVPPGAQLPALEPPVRASFFAPWGSTAAAGFAAPSQRLIPGLAAILGDSGLELLYQLLLDQVVGPVEHRALPSPREWLR